MGLWVWAARVWDGGAQLGECAVSYVYDGDTVALECGAGEETARIVGLDTPETRDAGCEAERASGKAATERLRMLVKEGDVEYYHEGHDKYGRALITLYVDGEDVAETLVGEGLAVRYGSGARIDWCERLES